MYPKDWQQFLREGAGKKIAIAQLSAQMTAYIGANSNKVHLHHDYATKSAEKHQLTAERFPIIFDTVERGLAIDDRPAHITFFHLDPDTDKWFQVTVKRSGEDKLIYLATFHRVKAREVKRKMRLHPTIRA